MYRPKVKETREQRAKRMQYERAKKKLYTRLLSISLIVILTSITCYYCPTQSQLDFIRNTRVPLSTVVAFLALLKFIKGILSQYNYGLSKTHSCKKVIKIFLLISLAVLVFPITAEEHKRIELTKNDGLFIYHYKDVAHVNPKVIHQRRSYVPCDLAIMVTQMRDLLTLHRDICEKSFNLNEDRPALDNTWGKFLALNYTTSLPVARRSCTTLGLELPEL